MISPLSFRNKSRVADVCKWPFMAALQRVAQRLGQAIALG